MNPSDFPNLARWQQVMANQDSGIWLVVMIAISALIWLLVFRWGFAQRMAIARVAIVSVFYVTLALALIFGVNH